MVQRISFTFFNQTLARTLAIYTPTRHHAHTIHFSHPFKRNVHTQQLIVQHSAPILRNLLSTTCANKYNKANRASHLEKRKRLAPTAGAPQLKQRGTKLAPKRKGETIHQGEAINNKKRGGGGNARGHNPPKKGDLCSKQCEAHTIFCNMT